MGGHALKNVEVRRLNRNDYDSALFCIYNDISKYFPGVRKDDIPSYFNKESFGDLDILIESEGFQKAGGFEQLRKMATEVCHATDFYKNGNVLSFNYREKADQTLPGFQVDIISMPADTFDYAMGYFSYNDLGNLIGRTAHKAGLTHGHDGLWYYLREGDYLFKNILLTRDYHEGLKFLGYNPHTFDIGFPDLEDIFKYVGNSTFFNRNIFLLENRNATSRMRDRKRKTYMEFLKWCEEHPELPEYFYPEDKRAWLPRISQHFPHFQAEYDEAMQQLQIQKRVKERYNGEYVSNLTGLQGKDLGGLMKKIKESFKDHSAFQLFVLDTPQDVLDQYIMTQRKDFV